jgi:hypothetical protein
MGIEFRGSNYRRDVSMGKRTIKEGEVRRIDFLKFDDSKTRLLQCGIALEYIAKLRVPI